MRLFCSVPVTVEVSHIFMCCLSESNGKKDNTQGMEVTGVKT